MSSLLLDGLLSTIASLTCCPQHADCRQYCSRRLRRIYKSVRFLHGRGRYQKKKLEPEGVKDVRWDLVGRLDRGGHALPMAAGLRPTCCRCRLYQLFFPNACPAGRLFPHACMHGQAF